MGESVLQLWCPVFATIEAGQTKVIHSLPLSKFKRLELISCYKSNLKQLSFKLSVDNSETGLGTQVYAKAGDFFDVTIDAFQNGLNAEIRVTNNEAFDIDFSGARLKL